MTSAKAAARKGVDFDLLDDIEAGDVLQIHFTEDSIGDVAYLVGMIGGRILTSSDEITLLAIMESRDWGWDENRYVEIKPTDTFDRTWFEGRMAPCIDKLEVKSRKRPFVDVVVLDVPAASIRYRFKPDGMEGVADILDLHDAGALTLGAPDLLRAALETGQWPQDEPDRGRAGRFTSWLTNLDHEVYYEYFQSEVLPHLELLRS